MRKKSFSPLFNLSLYTLYVCIYTSKITNEPNNLCLIVMERNLITHPKGVPEGDSVTVNMELIKL